MVFGYQKWGFWSFTMFILLFNVVIAEDNSVTEVVGNELEVNPFDVQEEGCPIIMERHELNINKLNGEWRMPFASLNWLADIGMALHNRSVKMSQITTICPKIVLSQHNKTIQNNATWTLLWKCPKLHGEFELRCWLQNNHTTSKYVCWNNKENRDLYLMIGATNHADYIVLVRCSPGEPGIPSAGMSWAILSKEVPMDTLTSSVLLDLVEGYGFDVHEFETELKYDDCEPQ